MRRTEAAVSLLCAALAWPAAASAATLHVAPDGNDGWSGLTARQSGSDGPLRTIGAAQARFRQLRAASTDSPVHVVVHAGRYELETPLIFTPADSGTEQAPTVYRAEGEVWLSGGVALVPAGPERDPGEVSFAAPFGTAAHWARAPQLYVNGRLATLAREPNEGRTWFAGQPMALRQTDPSLEGREAFAPAPDTGAFIDALGAADHSRAWLHVMQSWTSSRHRLQASTAPGSLVRVSPPAYWPFLHSGTDQRLWIENVEAAFDAAGEWIGGEQIVRYRRRTEDAGQLAAVAPRLERLVVVQGSGGAGPAVQHLHLVGFKFAHAAWLTPTAGWLDPFGAVSAGAAIEVDHARGLRIEGCEVTNVGGYAVWLRRDVRDSVVTGCHLHHLGAGGIKVGEPTQNGTEADASGANVFIRNTITDTGLLLPGAIGIWIGPSSDNRVTANTVANTTYSGIVVGWWRWGHGPSAARGNRIERNLVVGAGRGVMADLGGIYTVGTVAGTLIAQNVVREVRGFPRYGARAWGIYNDEYSSGVDVVANVVAGADDGGYFLHNAGHARLKDNLFASGGQTEIEVINPTERTRLELDGNLVIAATPPRVATRCDLGWLVAVGNKLALPDSRQRDAILCAGWNATSATVDATAAPRTLRLSSSDSQVEQRVAEIVRSAGSPSVEAPPPKPRAPMQKPPPLAIGFDGDSLALGERPPGMTYTATGHPELLRSVPEASAPGGRCLLIADRPDLVKPYEPFVGIALNHAGVRTSARFSIRVQPGTRLVHDWRDDAKPYRSGPRLMIDDRGVWAGSRWLWPAPAGIWLDFELAADVRPGGLWSVKMTAPGAPPLKADRLSFIDAAWGELRWMGFISEAQASTSACIARLAVAAQGL